MIDVLPCPFQLRHLPCCSSVAWAMEGELQVGSSSLSTAATVVQLDVTAAPVCTPSNEFPGWPRTFQVSLVHR